MRFNIQAGIKVCVVFFIILPMLGKNMYACFCQRSSHAVLCGKGIGCTCRNQSTTGFQRKQEVACFLSNMQAGGNFHAFEWFFLCELLCQTCNYWHFTGCPCNSFLALCG